MNKQM